MAAMCEQRRVRVPSPSLDLSKAQLRHYVNRRRWKVRRRHIHYVTSTNVQKKV